MNTQSYNVQHFLWIAVVCILFGVINTIGGWMIVDKMEGMDSFPGYVSLEFWRGVIQMIVLFLFSGALFSLAAFVFPSYRKNWRSRIHKPMWLGVVISGLFMTAMVVIGYYAV
jgi:hypothetical protein